MSDMISKSAANRQTFVATGLMALVCLGLAYRSKSDLAADYEKKIDGIHAYYQGGLRSQARGSISPGLQEFLHSMNDPNITPQYHEGMPRYGE